MNTNQVCPTHPNCSKPLPVRLAPMPVDERAMYVDSVCAVLIDSRFGPGRSTTPFEVHYSEYPELDLDILCDLINKNPFPSYLASSDAARKHNADAIRQRTATTIRCEIERCELAAVSTHSQSRSPTTLGRGSP